jgi:hypothetical protein
MDSTSKNSKPHPDDGADNNVAYIASLLDELNEARKKLREKDSLLSETQERLITLEEKVEQLTALNTMSDLHAVDEKANDDAEQKIDQGSLVQHDVEGDGVLSPPIHHMHGLDREFADSVGSGSIATFGNYVNAQRNLRFRCRKSSRASSVLSNTLRGKGEIEVIQNIARRTHSAEWDAICEDLDIPDKNGHTRNDHKTMTPFYSPPAQRQRYGDDTVLPHVGWGDLFFDLFYVGAAFNL